MSTPPRLALVGAGRWGRRYIETLGRLREAELAVVVSRNPETASIVGDRCEVVEDWREALDAQRIDGAILATPPEHHHLMARHCIEQRLAVLVEKPLTLSVTEADDLAHRARRRQSLLMVGHTHLFSAAFRALRARLRDIDGPFDIRGVGGNWGPFRTHTDALWDYGPHDIAMALALTGEAPSHVGARWVDRRPPAQGGGEVVRLRLTFPNGHHALLEVGNLMPEKRRALEVTAAGIALRYDDLADAKLVERELGAGGAEATWVAVPIDGAMPLDRQIIEFASAIQRAETADPSLETGVQVVHVLSAARCALEA